MNPKKLAALISSFFSLGVGGPLPSLPASLVVAGGQVDPGSLISMLSQASQANVNADGTNFQTSAAAAITLTSLQNLVQRLTNGGAVVVTLDSAYNIVNQIQNPFVGQTFPTTLVTNAGTTVAAPTLLSTDVTLAGTTTVTTGGLRALQGLITQVVTTVGAPMTAGTTFTSITQIGTSNLYTVALGTNALVPVVGSAIFLNVTNGTLPPGWYPIVKVTSAVSFVIAAPLSAVAWTAVAATVPGTILVPASQYTPGLQGVYAPLLTITGMYGMAAGVIVV